MPNYKHICLFTDGLLSVPDNPMSSEIMPIHSTNKFQNQWNTSDQYLRPRIFCLEHAVQIEELLQSKGGANVLVICHSGIYFQISYIFSILVYCFSIVIN